MNIIKEKAKLFAIQAHKGQIRKSEPDKPKIVHPIDVALKLEKYGFDDYVQAAGYLHDVVEDTDYTIQDIENNFGSDIADLVFTASEPDKSLSWEERKRNTIERIKTLPLRNKAVVCCDKISNLEDIMLKFEKNNNRNFDFFNRGEDSQKWYYESVYNSLIENEDENLPMFKDYKNLIDVVFYNKDNMFLKDVVFENDEDYYQKLKQLDAQKKELAKLKKICEINEPYVVELLGTPRSGKTTVINNLYDFFRKDFDIRVVEEFMTSKYYKESLIKELNDMSFTEQNKIIIEHICKNLKENISGDIVLLDRSINDRLVWDNRCYLKGLIDGVTYYKELDKYSEYSKELIDHLIVLKTDALTSVKRDYQNSLSLNERSFLNVDNVEEYNRSLEEIEEILKYNVECYSEKDTRNIPTRYVSYLVVKDILHELRRNYIKTLKKKIS